MQVLPVIHHIDRVTSIGQVQLARGAGADGVFLIAHDGNDVEMMHAAWEAKQIFPDFAIGANLLSMSFLEAVEIVADAGLDMLWADRMGVSSLGVTKEAYELPRRFPRLSFFASVAFKYQPMESDPAGAARMAAYANLIPTTSGPATGVAPELPRVAAMSAAASGCLAVASGVNLDNVASFRPYVSHVLVANGISEDAHRLCAMKLRHMIALAHANESEPQDILESRT